MEFNSRLLFIEILSSNRSITLYDRRGVLRGSSKQSHFPTSGNKTATGYSRSAPNACSRQEDSLSSTSRVVDEPEQINPEEAGGGGGGNQVTHKATDPGHELPVMNIRQLSEERRSQLLTDIRSEDKGAPSPTASMIYQVLTEQLGLSKAPPNGVKAIYVPNPRNSWRWLVLFNSENLKTKFRGKTTTQTFKHAETKTDYTYTFTTKGGKYKIPSVS